MRNTCQGVGKESDVDKSWCDSLELVVDGNLLPISPDKVLLNAFA